MNSLIRILINFHIIIYINIKWIQLLDMLMITYINNYYILII